MFHIDVPPQTRLSGEALARAVDVLSTPLDKKNLDILMTPQSLYYHGFFRKNMGKIPFIKFNKRRKSKKTLRNQMSGLSGRNL